MPTPRLRRVLLSSLGALMASLPAQGALVKGSVVGKSGQPRPYVRVDVSGPESQTLFTDAKGTFTADLPGGDYIVRITERNQRMQFDLQVSDDEGRTAPRFELRW